MLTVQRLSEVGIACEPDELGGSDDYSAVLEAAAVTIGENYQ